MERASGGGGSKWGQRDSELAHAHLRETAVCEARVLYYCIVLYCTVLYCTELCATVFCSAPPCRQNRAAEDACLLQTWGSSAGVSESGTAFIGQSDSVACKCQEKQTRCECSYHTSLSQPVKTKMSLTHSLILSALSAYHSLSACHSLCSLCLSLSMSVTPLSLCSQKARTDSHELQVASYREQTLTYVLRDVLGGNSKCFVLVTGVRSMLQLTDRN